MDTLMVNHPVLIIHVGYCIHTSVIMDSPYGHLSIWTVVHMDSHPYVPFISIIFLQPILQQSSQHAERLLTAQLSS